MLARLACSAGWVAGMNDLRSQHVSPWRGEDRKWSTREGWQDSPVVRGGSCCANIEIDRMHKAINEHAGKQTGSGPNPLSSPQWSRQVVRTRMWTLVGARMRAFGSRSLGVSTFQGMRDGHE
ncbi:hypothetical protein CRG98_030959 [Punica granatum]|uniref:Uncharacterized protein n=1 Tax=Punica granatum TaxID=22663 RepID=A0A2I0IX83_PUNGR|nr:hypothetical protein CRG98_030959 [Punica granatum]